MTFWAVVGVQKYPPGPFAPEVTGGVEAVRRAWSFLWDPAEPELRWRIGAAFALMISAKLTAIQVPFLFKVAVDALSSPAAEAVPLVGGRADRAADRCGLRRGCAKLWDDGGQLLALRRSGRELGLHHVKVDSPQAQRARQVGPRRLELRRRGAG